jgi:hypothetical protein
LSLMVRASPPKVRLPPLMTGTFPADDAGFTADNEGLPLTARA